MNVSESDFNRYLNKLFKVADKNQDGVLQPTEFKRLLGLSGFNFSQPTIDRVMMSADKNQDGLIQYEEFLPAMHEIVQRSSDTPPMPVEAAEIKVVTLDRSSYDPEVTLPSTLTMNRLV